MNEILTEEFSSRNNLTSIEKEGLNKKRNWDNYFTEKELDYYDKLYETEFCDLPETKTVTNYKKGELIGEGAYGKVFKGFDENHGRLIAIKELDLKKISTTELSVFQLF